MSEPLVLTQRPEPIEDLLVGMNKGKVQAVLPEEPGDNHVALGSGGDARGMQRERSILAECLLGKPLDQHTISVDWVNTCASKLPDILGLLG